MRLLIRVYSCAFVAIMIAGCGVSPEAQLRKMLASHSTGVIALPTGTIEVSSELQLAPGAHDLQIVGSGTLLKANNRFKGRAILVAEDARNIHLRDFSVEGNRLVLEKPLEAAPPENAFRIYYPNNGVLFDRVQGIEIVNVTFVGIVNFPILISRSSAIRIGQVRVEESGSHNSKGRNNTTGGILIEEGSSDFEVIGSDFRRILGNALWTHSLYTSPRSDKGLFAKNRFDTIGRDAIQVGHAIGVRVEDNTGNHIGFPPEIVDMENAGTPVAIDTSGNVAQSVYARNRFEEIDGKCLDLDGFHDGAVNDNHCINRRVVEEYPFGHFGIVMNNSNPDMQPRNVEISGNEIDGAKFGALFLMGSGHRVTGNTFVHINKAGCNENAARFGCTYLASEPHMLEAGIYLGRGVVRMVETRGNVILNNTISGHKMDVRCIVGGPGVSLAANTIQGNNCSDYSVTR